jgi:hypothetical protein
MHESVEVDTCPRCHGVWLDHGEMERILSLHRTRAAQKQQPSTLSKVGDSVGNGVATTLDAGSSVAGAGVFSEIGEAGAAVVEFFGGLF